MASENNLTEVNSHLSEILKGLAYNRQDHIAVLNSDKWMIAYVNGHKLCQLRNSYEDMTAGTSKRQWDQLMSLHIHNEETIITVKNGSLIESVDEAADVFIELQPPLMKIYHRNDLQPNEHLIEDLVPKPGAAPVVELYQPGVLTSMPMK